jgi:hypothetical protein
MALVHLNTLDSSILNQIPLSIRLSVGSDSVELEELPLSIQYIIREYVSETVEEIFVPEEIYDVRPKINPYNDLTALQTKKEAVIEYLENYFCCKRGIYPFDPEFGNMLHTHLQKKDTSLRQTLVGAELASIIRLINQSFDGTISVISSQIYPIDIGGAVEYNLGVTIKVDDETIKLNTGNK